MKITTILVAALSLALLAACDRGQNRPAASGSSAAPRNEAAPTPSTPPSSANSGKTEQNPVQGQVDPKEPAQHKDFQRNK